MRAERVRVWVESLADTLDGNDQSATFDRQEMGEVLRLLEERRRLLEFSRYCRDWMRATCEEVPPSESKGRGGYRQVATEDESAALWEACDKAIAYAEAQEDEP